MCALIKTTDQNRCVRAEDSEEGMIFRELLFSVWCVWLICRDTHSYTLIHTLYLITHHLVNPIIMHMDTNFPAGTTMCVFVTEDKSSLMLHSNAPCLQKDSTWTAHCCGTQHSSNQNFTTTFLFLVTYKHIWAKCSYFWQFRLDFHYTACISSELNVILVTHISIFLSFFFHHLPPYWYS